MKEHKYTTRICWVGNEGTGTSHYRSYNRNHDIEVEGKAHKILGSSDPSFMGDKTRYNPEEMFLSSLSSCHMLWFLHLCSSNGVVITDYTDQAEGIMVENSGGSGHFTKVTLHPKVVVQQKEMIEKASELHEEANQMCFIANSCNFPIDHNPTTVSS